MKALTLWQPWATLVALKAKQIETRSWVTSYRGPLAIHASKKMTAEAKVLCDREPFKRALDALFTAGDDLPLGAIVAVATLVDVIRTDSPTLYQFANSGIAFWVPPLEGSDEREFGDYTPGRYAWVLTNIRQLEFPIPCRGAQGLWQVPTEITEQIKAAQGGIMTTRTFTDLVVEATQILKHADAEKFAPVIRLLLASEQKERRKPRGKRATRVEVAKNGKRVRGGKAYVNLSNPDVRIEEGR